jgi:hypothetical protein
MSQATQLSTLGTQLATWGKAETDLARSLIDFRNAFLQAAQPLAAIRSELEQELRQQKKTAAETLKRLKRENTALTAHSKELARRLTETTQAAKKLVPHRRDLVLLALGGDSAALEVWQELAEQGDAFAFDLLDLCAALETFTVRLTLHRLETFTLESAPASTYTAPALTAARTRETFPNAPPICAPSARTGQRLSERLKT